MIVTVLLPTDTAIVGSASYQTCCAPGEQEACTKRFKKIKCFRNSHLFSFKGRQMARNRYIHKHQV